MPTVNLDTTFSMDNNYTVNNNRRVLWDIQYNDDEQVVGRILIELSIGTSFYLWNYHASSSFTSFIVQIIDNNFIIE